MKKITKTYVVPHRRKREQKTDYRLRLKLLKSGKPRFVVRKTSGNIVCQIIKHNPKGDETLFAATGRELKKFGWNKNCGNIPSAYLVGFLCGIKAKDKIKEAILDIGLYASTKGSRLYAALKGLLDAGISVPHSEEMLPKEERIKGIHIEKYRNIEIQKQFEEVKKKITKIKK